MTEDISDIINDVVLIHLRCHNFLFTFEKHIKQSKIYLLDTISADILTINQIFCVVLLCVFTFWDPCCDVRYDFRHGGDVRFVFASSYLLKDSFLVCAICFCLVVVVSSVCCVVFFFVLRALCCRFLWIVHFDCTFGIL